MLKWRLVDKLKILLRLMMTEIPVECSMHLNISQKKKNIDLSGYSCFKNNVKSISLSFLRKKNPFIHGNLILLFSHSQLFYCHFSE